MVSQKVASTLVWQRTDAAKRRASKRIRKVAISFWCVNLSIIVLEMGAFAFVSEDLYIMWPANRTFSDMNIKFDIEFSILGSATPRRSQTPTNQLHPTPFYCIENPFRVYE